MISLPSTTRLEILLAAAGTTVQFTAHAIDDTGNQLSYYANTGASNGTTPVTVVAAPTSPTVRTVRYVEFVNTDASVTHTLTIREDVSGTSRASRKYVLPPGAGVWYVANEGWKVLEANGAERTQNPVSAAASGTVRVLAKTTTAAEAAASWYGSMKDAGIPGAIAVGTPGLGGRTVTGSAEGGAIALPTPSSRWYLTDCVLSGTVVHAHMIYDLLWINSGAVVTTTTGQTVNSGTLPARDAQGTTSGEGCLIGLYFTAASTNAGAITNATVTYTNSAGTGSRTATLVAVAGAQIPATPVVGTIVWFQLDAGDKGVQSIQTLTLGTSLVTGSVSLFIARPLLMVPSTVANLATSSLVLANPGICVWDNPAIFHAMQASATTATSITATLAFADR